MESQKQKQENQEESRKKRTESERIKQNVQTTKEFCEYMNFSKKQMNLVRKNF